MTTSDAGEAAAPVSETNKTLGFVLLGLSVAGLLLARKEKRVRPVFDVVRLAVIAAAAVASMVILGETLPGRSP